MSQLLTDSEVSRQLAGLPNWRRADGDEPAIVATYELTDFVAALDFVNRVGHEAELMNHHPDIDIRWNKVTLVLSTHSEDRCRQDCDRRNHRQCGRLEASTCQSHRRRAAQCEGRLGKPRPDAGRDDPNPRRSPEPVCEGH